LFAGLFVARAEEEVAEAAEGPVPPGLKLGIEHGRGAADLRRGQALDAELGQHLFDRSRGDALHVHLGGSEHHRAAGAAPAFEALREERLLRARGLGHIQGQCAHWRIDLLEFCTVGIAAPSGAALVVACTEVLLAFEPHGSVHERGHDLRHGLWTFRDELFHDCGNRRIVACHR
jgi:hypothetical protein